MSSIVDASNSGELLVASWTMDTQSAIHTVKRIKELEEHGLESFDEWDKTKIIALWDNLGVERQ